MSEQRDEPRRIEYGFGGPRLPSDTRGDERLEKATLDHLATADIAFVEFLDAWVDKGIADGTLTIAKGAEYREAIAARCAELGEVPSVREHLVRLDLKPGDILAVIAPSDSSIFMQQMNNAVRRFLDYCRLDGVQVMVFPQGTELAKISNDRAPGMFVVPAASDGDEVRRDIHVNERLSHNHSPDRFAEALKRRRLERDRDTS